MTLWLIIGALWLAYLVLFVSLLVLMERRAQGAEVMRQLDRILAEHKRENARHD